MMIVIEGIDHVGKTTQVELLKQYLRNNDYIVNSMSFPDYSTIIGQMIYSILHNNESYDPYVLHLLLSANRWENKKRIEHLIKNNDIVLLNRYYQSNLVYGCANGLDLDWLIMLDKGLPEPELVIIIDSNVSELQNRTNAMDLNERNIEFQEKCACLYRELADKYNWIVVDGSGSKQDVHKRIVDVLEEIALLY